MDTCLKLVAARRRVGRSFLFVSLTLVGVGFCQLGCMAPVAGPGSPAGAGDGVRVWTEQITLPTHEVNEDTVPRFQVTDGEKYYPYSCQEDISSKVTPRRWTAVCIENRYLKVTVMPELGGRVFAIYDKVAGRDIIYRQKSIKPGRVGIRGAWISGGIEYDFPDSHTVTTHDKVHWTTRRYADGSASILVGDVERISRMGWTVELVLSPDRACLQDRVYLHNRTPMRQRYYYWTNAGVEAGEKTQMILPVPKVTGHFGDGLLDWPMRDGQDWSWFWKYPDATSTFAIGGQESFIGAYDHDTGVGMAQYADRQQLPGRKFWTWGTSPAGMRWYEVLSDDKKPYAELQAGPMLTQSLYAWMQPYEAQRFEEYWLPISRIGPFARVNPDAAVRLTAEGEQATAGVLPMRPLPGAKVELLAGEQVVQTWTGDLSPEVPLVETTKIEPTQAEALRLVVRDGQGRVVIEHTLGKYNLEGIPERLGSMDSGPGGITLPATATAETAASRYELQWLHCDYADAARTMEEALSRWPEDARIRFNGALLRLVQGQPAQAMELLEPLAAEKNASAQSRYYMALAKMQTGDLEGAAGLLAEIRSMDPAGPEVAAWIRAAHMLGARVLLQAGRYADARALIEVVLRGDPDYPYAAALGLYAARREARRDVAVELMQEHLALPDMEPMARAEVQFLTGRPDPTLRRMLQRDPDVAIELACDYMAVGGWGTAESILVGECGEVATNGMTWLMAGSCAARRGDEKAAARYRAKAEAVSTDMVFPSRVEELAAIQQALQAGPGGPRAAYYAGLVLMRLMRYDEAMAAWRQAIAIRDDNGLARRCLAVTLAAVKKDRGGAIGHLERAIAIDPRQPIYYQELARLLMEEKQFPAARDVLARAVRKAGATDSLMGDVAGGYLAVGEYRQAAKTLASHTFNVAEGRYGLHDDYAMAWIGVGLQALRDDAPGQALAALDKALEYPRNLAIGRFADAHDESMIYFWRGVALRKLGKEQEATAALETAVKQAGQERGRRMNYYRTLNAAHGMLALRALGRAQEADAWLEELTRAPASNRWMSSEWFRAASVFRQAWVEVLRTGAAGDAAVFAEPGGEAIIPAKWLRLSELAVEGLRCREKTTASNSSAE